MPELRLGLNDKVQFENAGRKFNCARDQEQLKNDQVNRREKQSRRA